MMKYLLDRIVGRWMLLITFAALTGNVIAVTTITSSLTSVASINAFCTVTSGILNFGNYEPISRNATQPLDVQSTFKITCTKGSSATITLNNGLNGPRAQGTTRAMSAGGAKPDFISYELYLNSSRSTVWNTTNVQSYTAINKSAHQITVYGRIPGGQDVGAGYYSDTVTINANF
jgi:spore coat protein U-like protein